MKPGSALQGATGTSRDRGKVNRCERCAPFPAILLLLLDMIYRNTDNAGCQISKEDFLC